MTATTESVLFALDADVLIYACQPGHELGTRVRRLFAEPERYRFCGSSLLLTEVLIKPRRKGLVRQTAALNEFLSHMDLRAADSAVCELAVAFGARHGLGVVDAVHLATAAHSGADVFLTNNSKDFDPERIFEIDVIFPGDLSADF